MRILAFLILMTALQAAAQVKNLPYRNGFETSAQRSEFTSVRLGDTLAYNWSYHVSSLKYAYHDYPVGGNPDDTVSDWLFTPPIKVTNGAVLSFRYFVYGITGTASPSDEFSIWYGKRNTNPENGTYVRLLDLTHKISSTMSNWRDTAGIQLPFTTDTGYVSFRYRATTNWFTIGVDSVVVKIPGLAVNEIRGMDQVRIYPNPCVDVLNIQAASNIRYLSIIASDGRELVTKAIDNATYSVPLTSLNGGMYTLRLETVDGITYHRLIKL